VNAALARARRIGPLVSRIAAAAVGGYVLAALASVAAIALAFDKVQGVLTGQLLSFVFYAAAVIWVFAARTAWRAWAGLLVVGVPLLVAAWSVWFAGAAS
jgi:hypothetical protein